MTYFTELIQLIYKIYDLLNLHQNATLLLFLTTSNFRLCDLIWIKFL